MSDYFENETDGLDAFESFDIIEYGKRLFEQYKKSEKTVITNPKVVERIEKAKVILRKFYDAKTIASQSCFEIKFNMLDLTDFEIIITCEYFSTWNDESKHKLLQELLKIVDSFYVSPRDEEKTEVILGFKNLYLIYMK